MWSLMQSHLYLFVRKQGDLLQNGALTIGSYADEFPVRNVETAKHARLLVDF